MYATRHFVQANVPLMRTYLAEHPLAALAINTMEGPSIDHLPMEWEAGAMGEGRLLGHVARSNPIWREFESGPALAVFSGHQGYVSPDWYPTKLADPRVVPTWNYVTVHVSGTLSFFHEPDRIHALLARLTERFESRRATPWRITDAPAEHVAKLVGAVVGVELQIERMLGKWKLSQNRPPEDQHGVIDGLRREGGSTGAALADLMSDQLEGES